MNQFYTLTKINGLKSIEDTEVRKMLKKLYLSKKSSERMIAPVLNSIVSSGSYCFILSRRSVEDLYKKDRNSKVKKINNIYYLRLVKELISSKYLAKAKDSTRMTGSVYKVVNRDLLICLYNQKNPEFYKRQEEEVLSYCKKKLTKIESKEAFKQDLIRQNIKIPLNW